MFSNRKNPHQQQINQNLNSSKQKIRTNYKNENNEEGEDQMIKDIGDKMIDQLGTEQLRCHYHPNKIITNFCEEQQCLLPMCPNCVAIHSDFHKSNKSQGQFRTLDLIIGQLIMQIEDQFKTVKEGQMIIKGFNEQIELQPDNIRNQFEMLKIKALQAVEDSFEKLRIKMEDSLANYQNNNESQIGIIESQLEQYCQTLDEIQEDLKDDPLPTIVKLKSENTLNRLLTQMPNVQPLVSQIQSNMIQIFPDLNTVYNIVSQNLNANLQVRSKELSNQTIKPNINNNPNNPKSNTYLQPNYNNNHFMNIHNNNVVASNMKNNNNFLQQQQQQFQQQQSAINQQPSPPSKQQQRSITPNKIIINQPQPMSDQTNQYFPQQHNIRPQYNPIQLQR